MSEWAISQKAGVCSVIEPPCGTSYNIGDVVVKHPNSHVTGSYGCVNCGLKFNKVWEITINPLPAWVLQVPNFSAAWTKYVVTTIMDGPVAIDHLKKEPSKKTYRLVSFGYKFGVPAESKRYQRFDTRRTIRNPWSDPVLRRKNGLYTDVQQFVIRCQGGKRLVKRIINSFTYNYQYTAYIGCHGGRHRSVAVAELVARELRNNGINVEVTHRDLKVDVKEVV